MVGEQHRKEDDDMRDIKIDEDQWPQPLTREQVQGLLGQFVEATLDAETAGRIHGHLSGFESCGEAFDRSVHALKLPTAAIPPVPAAALVSRASGYVNGEPWSLLRWAARERQDIRTSLTETLATFGLVPGHRRGVPVLGTEPVYVQHLDSNWQPTGAVTRVDDADIETPPTVKKSGEFVFAFHCDSQALMGKRMICSFALTQGQAIRFETDVTSAETGSLCHVQFHDEGLSSPQFDTVIPFDVIQLYAVDRFEMDDAS
jgi:hypothetical protein